MEDKTKDVDREATDRQKAKLAKLQAENDPAPGKNAGDTQKTGYRTHEERIAALEAENEQLRRSLAAQKGQTTRARSAAALAEQRAREPGTPTRAIPGKPPPKRIEADKLLAAIGEAGEVLIVASDGEREVPGIPALAVTGGASAFRATPAGLLLAGPDFTVSGPGELDKAWQVAGFGLLLDGKIAAWGPLPRVVNIGGGTRRQLASDVLF